MDNFQTLETEPKETIREAGTPDMQFTIHREDPYGFYRVEPRQGPTPEVLSGKYTSPRLAEEAIELYITNEKKRKENEAKLVEAQVITDGERTTQKPDGHGPSRAQGSSKRNN